MRALIALCALLLAPALHAETTEITPQPVTAWKSVFGQVETRVEIPARARIGGTIVALDVTEGDRVSAGQTLARVEDDKLQYQLDSFDAQLESAQAQLETAQSELARGEALQERGVITTQRLEQLRTDVEVITSNISNIRSQRLVVEQQVSEGDVLAPEEGVVLSVPVSRGSVVTMGETVAQIGGGGTYLRLNVPERHAGDLSEGDELVITTTGGEKTGTLVKLYPLIEGGRLQADVEVAGLDARFIGRRVPVRLPVGEREALLVPENALSRAGGLDFVTVETPDGPRERVVVPGETVTRGGGTFREILTGLEPGDMVVTGDE
ncbi:MULTISPECIES: efflux RND transporter periplasmic adaptor subunit [Salipiger]|jgi:multidrug efflux system membrane fusion protein|uniref:RND family efflux transporter, MFP subunit n=1 Tax=Salipiger profundus TaxID=1229727 RepID=A0A1U7D258_9RHOB|nr:MULTISPECIES: efflux RND transporter periplasmic adaptor subunit [Salipiger]APX22150.1 RND family efflux transporter, MFP subunit [Salipiger profundus]GGA07843.1 membrane protein [Salipiger profundus]SFC46792.1 RND family efflux transporter, MFP subunit [Salipiger profundus]